MRGKPKRSNQKNSVHELELHEEMVVDTHNSSKGVFLVTRVPSGWIYERKVGSPPNVVSSTFVPESNH